MKRVIAWCLLGRAYPELSNPGPDMAETRWRRHERALQIWAQAEKPLIALGTDFLLLQIIPNLLPSGWGAGRW